MVCSNVPRIDDDELRRRASILGVSFERAKFLSRCAKSINLSKRKDDRVVIIPYDPRVQIDEALRLEIGFKHTAQMMGMSKTEISAMGYDFPTRSAYPPAGNRYPYSLFRWEPLQGEDDLYKTQQ